MGLFAKIFGICKTNPPEDAGCWKYSGKKIEIETARTPELSKPGGAIRLEGKGLDKRVLVFSGQDNNLYALKNRCTHIGGRRLDPVIDPSGSGFQIRCCSVMGSIYDIEGNKISGPAKKPLTFFKTDTIDNKIKKIIILL